MTLTMTMTTMMMMSVIIMLVIVITLSCDENVNVHCHGQNTLRQQQKQQRHSPFTTAEKIEMREKVKNMFNHAYNGYMDYAYPHDELKPISKTYTDSLIELGTVSGSSVAGSYRGVSMTLIDSLSTLAVMNEKAKFKKAIQSLSSLSFDVDARVSLFETNIRILGGLISAHLLATDPSLDLMSTSDDDDYVYTDSLLLLAIDLADRLLKAFTQSPSTIPYAWVNLKHGVMPNETTHTCLAGAGTLILEMGALSALTGRMEYFDLAYGSLQTLFDMRSSIDLFGNGIDIHQTKHFQDNIAGVGSGQDSFYEYLLKGSVLFSSPRLYAMYARSASSIDKYVRIHDWLIEVNSETGAPVHPQFNSLTAFYPSLLVMTGALSQAASLTRSFFSLWQRYHALPERFLLMNNDVHWTERHYILRPELAESIYYLYQATHHDIYLHMAKIIYTHIEEHMRVSVGYASVRNVESLFASPEVPTIYEDHLNSFFLSETTKYLYLIFAETDHWANKNYVFTTEGHPLPIMLEWQTLFQRYETGVPPTTATCPVPVALSSRSSFLSSFSDYTGLPVHLTLPPRSVHSHYHLLYPVTPLSHPADEVSHPPFMIASDAKAMQQRMQQQQQQQRVRTGTGVNYVKMNMKPTTTATSTITSVLLDSIMNMMGVNTKVRLDQEKPLFMESLSSSSHIPPSSASPPPSSSSSSPPPPPPPPLSSFSYTHRLLSLTPSESVIAAAQLDANTILTSPLPLRAWSLDDFTIVAPSLSAPSTTTTTTTPYTTSADLVVTHVKTRDSIALARVTESVMLLTVVQMNYDGRNHDLHHTMLLTQGNTFEYRLTFSSSVVGVLPVVMNVLSGQHVPARSPTVPNPVSSVTGDWYDRIDVTLPVPHPPPSSSSSSSSSSPLPLYPPRRLRVVFGLPQDGCSPFVNPASSLVGAAVVVVRGVCTFYDKIRAAQEAKASAVLVINQQQTPIVMRIDNTAQQTHAHLHQHVWTSPDDYIHIPALMMRASDGRKLREMVAEDVDVLVDIDKILYKQGEFVHIPSKFTNSDNESENHSDKNNNNNMYNHNNEVENSNSVNDADDDDDDENAVSAIDVDGGFVLDSVKEKLLKIELDSNNNNNNNNNYDKNDNTNNNRNISDVNATSAGNLQGDASSAASSSSFSSSSVSGYGYGVRVWHDMDVSSVSVQALNLWNLLCQDSDQALHQNSNANAMTIAIF